MPRLIEVHNVKERCAKLKRTCESTVNKNKCKYIENKGEKTTKKIDVNSHFIKI